MKLYSILNEVILEAAERMEVDDTIQAGERDIEPYVLGLSKAGNPILRAYQYRGVTDTEQPGWKTFRLDKIRDWNDMNDMPFRTPISDRVRNIPKYNPRGDRSMITIYKQAKF
jgi:hypothetical protein